MDAQKSYANVKLFQWVTISILNLHFLDWHLCAYRYVVHVNVSFASFLNWFFWDFLNGAQPSYTPPSQYVLSYTILDGEAARVQLKEMDRVENKKLLTHIIDG